MCGIYGCLATRGAPPPSEGLLRRMALSLGHRGPDEQGLFRQGPVALGSRRLSIVDLVTGRQPLHNESGTIHLVCNGEIYNSPRLRRELEGRHAFATRSDVEVLVHLYEELDLRFLDRVEGMFALALWDAPRGRLLLARDRLGEKPLFHATHDGTVVFGSELTALKQMDGVGGEVDPGAIRLYLGHGCFPAPRSPWRDVRKLEPGTMLLFDQPSGAARRLQWWSLRDRVLDPGPEAPGTYDAAARALRETVEGSVRRQLMGDVPVGVALSGGLDSGWIAAVAAAQSDGPIHTFTVSFTDSSYDEGGPAAALARRLGSRHHVIRADRPALMEAMHCLARHMDEPLADPAVLPTFLLAREARRHVKVLLGGEGADELFGGYPTYIGHQAARGYARWPAWLRRGVVRPLVDSLPDPESKVSLRFLLKRFVRHADRPLLDRHAAWFGVFPPGEIDDLAGPRLGPGGGAGVVGLFRELAGPEERWSGRDLDQVLYLDARTYLGEGLLTKLDRVSMSCSLECRSPYLGRDVVHFAAGLPIEWKVKGGATKRILRHAASDAVPAALIRRQKRGLSVPLAAMFREELKEHLQETLEPRRLDAEGYLNGGTVRRLVGEHLGGRIDRSRQLWSLLSLVHWYRLPGGGVRSVRAVEEVGEVEALQPAAE